MPSNGYKCPDSSEQDTILKLLGKYKNHHCSLDGLITTL